MTPTPIQNKAAWAHYNPDGNILFGTIGWTKQESEDLFKTYYEPDPKCECLFIAIDIDVIR